MLSSDIADKANRSNSYLNQPLFGRVEFVVNDSNGVRLAFATRKQDSIEDSVMASRLKYECQWTVFLY